VDRTNNLYDIGKRRPRGGKDYSWPESRRKKELGHKKRGLRDEDIIWTGGREITAGARYPKKNVSNKTATE